MKPESARVVRSQRVRDVVVGEGDEGLAEEYEAGEKQDLEVQGCQRLEKELTRCRD